jgi:tetratricopeptide (TPR) repeat protein
MREQRIAKLQALLEADPHDSFARYALALEYGGMEKMDLAIGLLEEVIRLDPRYVPAYQQLGYLYQRTDRKDDAIAIFREGMGQASQQGDSHARGEMQEALDEILG